MSKAQRVDHGPALRRFKPYPEYKNSCVEWLGEIPAHWDVRRLRHVGEAIIGLTYQPDDVVGPDEGTLVLRASNVSNGRIVYEDNVFVRSDIPEHLRTQLGDILICARSGSRHLIGKNATIGKREIGLTFGTFMIVFRSPCNTFLFYVFNSALFEYQSGTFLTSTINQLTVSNLKDMTIPVAPDREQESIAAFLDRETAKIDALVSKKERLIELLQEKRAALITRAVTRGLDPDIPMKDSGVEWLRQIPELWELKRIKNVSSFVTSGSRGWAEYYSEEGPLFLRIGNLKSGSIDLNLEDVQHIRPPEGKEGERTRVRGGDLLISITALIGAVAIVPRQVPEAFVNQHLALVRISDRRINPRWLAYCVLSQFGQSQLLAELYGGTKDGLSLDDIRSLVILVPPPDEQQAIVSFLDAAETKFSSLLLRISNGIERLRELRTALISAAVTGKIDVRQEVAA